MQLTHLLDGLGYQVEVLAGEPAFAAVVVFVAAAGKAVIAHRKQVDAIPLQSFGGVHGGDGHLAAGWLEAEGVFVEAKQPSAILGDLFQFTRQIRQAQVRLFAHAPRQQNGDAMGQRQIRRFCKNVAAQGQYQFVHREDGGGCPAGEVGAEALQQRTKAFHLFEPGKFVAPVITARREEEALGLIEFGEGAPENFHRLRQFFGRQDVSPGQRRAQTGPPDGAPEFGQVCRFFGARNVEQDSGQRSSSDAGVVAGAQQRIVKRDTGILEYRSKGKAAYIVGHEDGHCLVAIVGQPTLQALEGDVQFVVGREGAVVNGDTGRSWGWIGLGIVGWCGLDVGFGQRHRSRENGMIRSAPLRQVVGQADDGQSAAA